MAYDLEHVARELKSRLQDELPDELDVVETNWSATDPVTLADPETWFLGHKPTVLELESSEFPFVAVVAAARTPETGRGASWDYQKKTQTLFVDYFVVADDEATVNKRANRYAEAICNILQGQAIIYGYYQQDYEPAVNLSEASRHAKHSDNADFFDSDDVDFIQAGRITVKVEG